MHGLSNQDLYRMRDIVQAYYKDIIEVYTQNITINREGKKTYGIGSLVTTAKGQLSIPRGNETKQLTQLRDDGVLKDETYRLALPYNTTITTEHKVKTSDGKYWNVVSVSDSYTFVAALEVIITRESIKADE